MNCLRTCALVFGYNRGPSKVRDYSQVRSDALIPGVGKTPVSHEMHRITVAP